MKILKKIRSSLASSFSSGLKRFDKRNLVLQHRLKDEYIFSLLNTRFVSSRGLLFSCDIHLEEPVSGTTAIPDLKELFDSHDPRSHISVYICTNALPNFLKKIRGKRCRDFILVTGDSVLTVGDHSNFEIASELADHPNLLHWYAQNLSFSGEKVSHLPVGMDYHTPWLRQDRLNTRYIFPINQEAELLEILEWSIPTIEREPLAYCDWHFSLSRGDRKKALEFAEQSALKLTDSRLPRWQTWIYQSKCQFVSSPLGVGLDCHRTWEALLLGCVPIVSRSAIAPLFEHLPVIQVDNWADLTNTRLQSFSNSLRFETFDFSKVLLRHWVSKIKMNRVFNIERMTLNKFRTHLLAK